MIINKKIFSRMVIKKNKRIEARYEGQREYTRAAVEIEGITVISSLFLFYENFHTHKKAQNANKQLSPHQKLLCAQKNAALSVLFACLHFVSLSLLVSGFLVLSGFTCEWVFACSRFYA